MGRFVKEALSEASPSAESEGDVQKVSMGQCQQGCGSATETTQSHEPCVLRGTLPLSSLCTALGTVFARLSFL